MKYIAYTVCPVVFMVLLTACGGGSGSGVDSDPVNGLISGSGSGSGSGSSGEVANKCTDYSVGLLENQPVLIGPEQMPFKDFSSIFSTPNHMVHDELVNPQEALTITAKFQYGQFLNQDLEEEDVHAYIWGTGMSAWESLGEFTTDDDGLVSIPVTGRDEGDYVIRVIVEGDLTSSDGYLSVRNPGHQAIVFDLDGTLTISDFEQLTDYAGISTAEPYQGAKELVQMYRDLGYQLLFVSARPYYMTKGSREWLANPETLDLDQAVWHLRTSMDGEIISSSIASNHEQFKTDYLNKLIQQEGIDIVRVYGNAISDIGAYDNVGLPKSETYIIGPLAGVESTQDTGSDYVEHVATIASSTPPANCEAR